MANCPSFIPHDQRQLVYKWGGTYGSANCTACSAGVTGEGHTCGALLYTGAQIRAASSEPRPDPASPGLNLAQVDAALYKLSSGRINLDCQYRTLFGAVATRVKGGAFAILQVNRGTLVDKGYGFGNGFRGGHAVTIVYRGRWRFHDPLTGWHDVTESALVAAAGALIINPNTGERCGAGRAYVAFSRDVVANYHVHIDPGVTFVWTLRDGMIWSRVAKDFATGTGASCKAVRRFLVHPKGPLAGIDSRRLAVITQGPLEGKAVGENSPRVHIKEV